MLIHLVFHSFQSLFWFYLFLFLEMFRFQTVPISFSFSYLFFLFLSSIQSRFVGYLEQVFTQLNGRLPPSVSYRIKSIKIDGISSKSVQKYLNSIFVQKRTSLDCKHIKLSCSDKLITYMYMCLDYRKQRHPHHCIWFCTE